jgi:hypothetical protein
VSEEPAIAGEIKVPDAVAEDALLPPSWLDVVPPADPPAIDAGNGDIAKVSQQGWDAIEQANVIRHLFRHGGHAVRVERGDDGAAILQTITQDRLGYVLARVACFYRVNRHWRAKAEPAPGSRRARHARTTRAAVARYPQGCRGTDDGRRRQDHGYPRV